MSSLHVEINEWIDLVQSNVRRPRVIACIGIFPILSFYWAAVLERLLLPLALGFHWLEGVANCRPLQEEGSPSSKDWPN